MKEIYIAELERIAARLEAQGVPSDAAYEQASTLAMHAVRERLADMADDARKRMKEDQ